MSDGTGMLANQAVAQQWGKQDSEQRTFHWKYPVFSACIVKSRDFQQTAQMISAGTEKKDVPQAAELKITSIFIDRVKSR